MAIIIVMTKVGLYQKKLRLTVILSRNFWNECLDNDYVNFGMKLLE